jgi:hypothetical protein
MSQPIFKNLDSIRDRNCRKTKSLQWRGYCSDGLAAQGEERESLAVKLSPGAGEAVTSATLLKDLGDMLPCVIT